jgi:TonB family protein
MKDLAMSWKARAISLLLTLSGGAVLLSAMPAHAESSETGTAEVQVEKSSIKVKRIRYTAPRFPERAVQDGVSGFVIIEFIVNTKGRPVELRVVGAKHPELFEHALISAAKRWRYKPLVVDNVPRETPMRAIVRFETLT